MGTQALSAGQNGMPTKTPPPAKDHSLHPLDCRFDRIFESDIDSNKHLLKTLGRLHHSLESPSLPSLNSDIPGAVRSTEGLPAIRLPDDGAHHAVDRLDLFQDGEALLGGASMTTAGRHGAQRSGSSW